MFFQPHIDFLELPCPRLPKAFDGLVVLHLSDLHITKWTKRLGQWQDALTTLTPDLLVITGDLGHRSWLWNLSFDTLQKFLKPFAPRLGTYFILGNHDSVKLGPALAETTDAKGRPRILLQNETVFLHAGETPGDIDIQLPPKYVPATRPSLAQPDAAPRVALIGIHQHRRIDTDIPAALRAVSPHDFKLMLLHYPDLVHPAVAAGADICLAGHTHGGQICWPDGSPIFGQDTLTAAQCTGVHRVNGTWMVVNRGIGAAGVKMRLFCPPHAVQMKLRAG